MVFWDNFFILYRFVKLVLVFNNGKKVFIELFIINSIIKVKKYCKRKMSLNICIIYIILVV